MRAVVFTIALVIRPHARFISLIIILTTAGHKYSLMVMLYVYRKLSAWNVRSRRQLQQDVSLSDRR